MVFVHIDKLPYSLENPENFESIKKIFLCWPCFYPAYSLPLWRHWLAGSLILDFLELHQNDETVTDPSLFRARCFRQRVTQNICGFD